MMKAMNIPLLLSAWLVTGLGSIPMAHAQQRPHWEAVLLAEQGLFHYDLHSVTKKDHLRTFTSMVDYKAPQESSDGRKYLSTVTEIQLNCKSGAARITHISYHAENMGHGKEVRKEGMIRDWLDIPPGSPIERIARRVC